METILYILLQLVTVGLLGIVNALCTYFLDYTFWKGAIFQKWLPFMSRTLLKIHGKAIPKDDDTAKDEASTYFLYKVLGGCPVCTNIWMGFVAWTIISLSTNLFPIYFAIPFLMISNAFLRKLVGATY